MEIGGTILELNIPTMGNQMNNQMNNYGRIGSYAISTIDFDTCLMQTSFKSDAKSETKTTASQRKKRGVKEIVHKIFSDCAMVIKDPFWMEIFTSASMGRFPPKFNYSDGILNYKKGMRNQHLEVSNNPTEAAHACMEFFRSNGGLFSPLDIKTSNELQLVRSQEPVPPLTWALANKKLQECLLSNYVIYMKDIMGLSRLEMEKLRQVITLGIINKYFGKHNIHVDNNRIFSIEGLLWDNERRDFYIDPNLKPNITRTYVRNKEGSSSVDPSEKDMIPTFTGKWDKYVDSLDKKLIKHDRTIKRITITNQTVPGRRIHLVTTTTATTDPTSTDPTSTDDYDSDE